jgi:hypothetical protein
MMKRLWVLLCCSGTLLCAADLAGVHSVYCLPMSRGLDQYLANRLTNERVFQVVTDPKMANAVFTDRIGEAFESQMEVLLPPPPPPPPAPAADEKQSSKDAKDTVAKEEKKESNDAALMTDTVNKLGNPAVNSTFGRGKGTLFLVDLKTHEVLWSTFVQPRGSSGPEMDRTATEIVNRLKKDLNPGKK